MAPIGGKKAKKGILERLNSGEVVIGDGGFVFSLEKRGYVKAGPWTPEAAVEHPEAVRQLHREFLRAGSNVMQTFTFYASEDKLENRGNYVAEKISGQKVNEAACDIARQVADEGDALVAGGVSQTPSYLSCKSETEVKKVFQQQLEVFMKKNVDFLIAEYFEHVEEAVWAVEALKASGKPVAATMCIGPEGDLHGVTPGECAVRLVKAGASIVGVNCHFDPTLLTVANRDLLIFQNSPLDWSPESQPGGTFKNTPERPTTWGSGSSAGAVDSSPTTSGRLQRSWPQKGAFCHQLQKNMAAGEVVWTCTPNPGLEPGPGRNTGRTFG
uniref:Betaine--homocysteine S-methyltransferase n=1 Tax=Myotis myotis TaxID=51298 RepID=A0A7J7XY97_MYOMY|nr:betaine--homocysteine S-methyltransferase [Myotis myotis]